jgi:hypothetical protein
MVFSIAIAIGIPCLEDLFDLGVMDLVFPSCWGRGG